MRPNVDVEVRGWEGWYFEEDYLCSPEGDRFSPLCVRVCFFLRQTEQYRELMRWRFKGARSGKIGGRLVSGGDVGSRGFDGVRTLGPRHEAPEPPPDDAGAVPYIKQLAGLGNCRQ